MNQNEPVPHTFHFGLVGFPLDHSLSPRLHTSALRKACLEGDYLLIPIPNGIDSKNQLTGILTQVSTGILHGINVTIPYKQTIVPLLDTVTRVALETGAVNTVYLNDNQLVGDNTDVAGFFQDLLEFYPALKSKPGNAIVLGAGGAARAVVYVLAKAGWKVWVAARNRLQVEQLCTTLQSHTQSTSIKPGELSRIALHSLLDELMPSLIVNTTPIGMNPDIYSSPWPVGLAFPPNAFIYDLIYNPPQTVFLKGAAMAGLHTRNGIGMLVKQAAASFELWTGQNCPINAMWLAIPDFQIDR